MRAFLVTFLMTLILASIVLEPVNAVSASNALSDSSDIQLGSNGNSLSMTHRGYCEGRCKDRCAAAGMKDRCLKYCNICCLKCKCVPKGTFGNKHLCPCYRDMKNSKGKPKCP